MSQKVSRQDVQTNENKFEEASIISHENHLKTITFCQVSGFGPRTQQRFATGRLPAG